MSDLGVVIVTGAGKGIGEAIAVGFAKEGASVCCAARTESDVRDTMRQIESNGGKAIAVPTDVTDMASVQGMVDATVDAFGGLDILVANAGGNRDHGSVETGNPDDWQATMDVNLTGSYYCARAVIPHLKRRGGGKIIIMGSQLGHRGMPAEAAYSCAKAGQWMLTRILARELFEYNIAVNELIPGPVITPGSEPAQRRSDSVFAIGSEWIKQPEDVVPMALFLAQQPNTGPSAQSFKMNRRDG